MLSRSGAPYADFAELRRESPGYWQVTPDGDGYGAVLRHADVATVSRQPDLYSSARGFVVIESLSESQLAMMRFSLLGMDPPDHAKYRRLLPHSFTPRIVASLEPRVRAITREVIDRGAALRVVEFVEDMAAELLVQVIGEVLGVPAADRPQLRAWAAQLTGSQDPDLNPGADDAAPNASIEMAVYAMGLAASRRGKDGADLTTAAVNAAVDGHTMTDAEFGFLVQLATAGSDTTRNLLASGTLALLDHPAAMTALRANPALLPTAIEEMLRFEAPLHYFRRTATRDTTLGGQAIRGGDRVALMYTAANRDPAVFADPDRFDIHRDPNPHLAFGIGEHFCLGAALARLEASMFFEALLAAFPHIEKTGEPRRQRSNLNDALKFLPVRLEAA